MKQIAVIGVGYVGLVTAACFSDLGNKVIALDISEERIAGLKRGEMPIYEPGLKELIEHYKSTSGIANVGFDATGQKTFGDFLKRMGISATGVDFSAKQSNKTQLYNDFKLMVENRKIKVV